MHKVKDLAYIIYMLYLYMISLCIYTNCKHNMTVASLLKLSAPPEKKQHDARFQTAPNVKSFDARHGEFGLWSCWHKNAGALNGANWPFCRMGTFDWAGAMRTWFCWWGFAFFARPSTSDCDDGPSFAAYLRVALPSAVLMWAEWWAYEIMSLLAGAPSDTVW